MVRDAVSKTSSGGRSLPRQTDIEHRLCISVPEAAKMLGMSRNYTYELVRTKQIPVVKFGKRLLIPRVLLEKMLERGDVNEGTH